MSEYTVSQDKNGYWYAHRVGFSYIPVFGSFSKSKKYALQCCADSMCMTYKEFMEWRRRKRNA